MDKLDLIIHDKKAELLGLQAELNEALTGIESPDYQAAGRLQPLIHGVTAEIARLEKLRVVLPAAQDFQTYLSRLLTEDALTTLELWTHIHNYWGDVTTRLLEIRKGKVSRRVSCTLWLTEPTDAHLHGDITFADLQHIGWRAGRGKRLFQFKANLKNPDAFDRFCQLMSVTMLEVLPDLWRHGQQYYRFR